MELDSIRALQRIRSPVDPSNGADAGRVDVADVEGEVMVPPNVAESPRQGEYKVVVAGGVGKRIHDRLYDWQVVTKGADTWCEPT